MACSAVGFILRTPRPDATDKSGVDYRRWVSIGDVLPAAPWCRAGRARTENSRNRLPYTIDIRRIGPLHHRRSALRPPFPASAASARCSRAYRVRDVERGGDHTANGRDVGSGVVNLWTRGSSVLHTR